MKRNINRNIKERTPNQSGLDKSDTNWRQRRRWQEICENKQTRIPFWKKAWLSPSPKLVCLQDSRTTLVTTGGNKCTQMWKKKYNAILRVRYAQFNWQPKSLYTCWELVQYFHAIFLQLMSPYLPWPFWAYQISWTGHIGLFIYPRERRVRVSHLLWK